MDRKIIRNTMISAILALMVIMMLVLGCSAQQKNTDTGETSNTEATSTVTEEPQVVETGTDTGSQAEATEESTAEPEPEETTPAGGSSYNLESLPKDQQRKIKMIRGLLEEARNGEENYFFRYSAPGILQTDVWVKGDIMKRAIHRADELDKFTTYNMVYMNMKTLKADGYCETTKSKCWEGHGPFPETYSKWDIKTPKEWTLELGDDFMWALDNKVSDQLYHIIDYYQPDRIVRVYVNDYKGWPGKVEIYPAGAKMESARTSAATEVYLYDDMDIGGVSDDDVTPG